MPSLWSDYENVQIDASYDGVVMLNQSGVFFNDAEARPDGRKIYHIFEHAVGDDSFDDNCPYMLSNERKSELYSKANEDTFENIQTILEHNGISLDEWCPPLTENGQYNRNISCDSTPYSEKLSYSSSNIKSSAQKNGKSKFNKNKSRKKEEVFINDGLLDEEGCEHIENGNENRGKENRNNGESNDENEVKRNNDASSQPSRKIKENNNKLMKNIQNKRNGKTKKFFKCNYCKFSTIYKFNMNSHLLKHSSVKRFKCSKCSYKANHLTCVKNHMAKYADHKMIQVISIPSLVESMKSQSEKNEVYTSYPAERAVGYVIYNEDKDKSSFNDSVSLTTSISDNDIVKNSTVETVEEKKSKSDVLLKSKDLKINIIKLTEKQIQDLNNGVNYRIVLKNGDKLLDRTNNSRKCKLKIPSETVKQLTEGKKKLLKSLECPYTHEYRSKIIQHNLTHKKNVTYNCRDCDFTAKCLYVLKQHKKAHTENEIITCQYCSFETNNLTTFKKHKFKHIVPKERVIKCVDCSFTADSRNALLEHCMIHKKPLTTFQCDNCTYATTNETFLAKHMSSHKNPKIKSFKCCECSFTSVNKSSLMEHARTHDKQKEKMLKCRQCSYTAPNKKFMIKHMKFHKSKEYLKCFECSFTTKNRNDLIDHNQVHMKREIFDCRECPFTTTFKLSLIKHKLLHTKTEKDIYQCPECPFKSNKEKILQTHILIHVYSKVHKCRSCDYSSNNKTKLKRHMMAHTATIEKTNYRVYRHNKLTVQLVSKNNQSFKCFKCNYTCATEHLLNQHTLTHLETKILKCEHCDYETNFRGNLVKHVLIHVDEYIIN